MIFDYCDFIKEEYKYDLKGPNDKVKRKEHSMPENYDLFFEERGVCPSCDKKAEKVFSDIKKSTLGADLFANLEIWECSSCGWWESFEKYTEAHDYIEKVDEKLTERLKHSILKSFNIEDKEIPVRTLLRELKKENEAMYDINPYIMEEVAQYVFSSYYDCKVKHVGKSGDGGKDLIMVQADDPILVQVKRRSKPDDVESVSTIRDFLGTMFIEKTRKGIVVSTADHFSKPSKKVQTQLLEENRLETFELIDFNKFCNMLNVIKKDDTKPWLQVVEHWESNNSG